MAASQDPSDNPVAINVVPMVDVIFCLCVFFMCSFQFKQVEGRLDSWLPRDKGMGAGAAPPASRRRSARAGPGRAGCRQDYVAAA